jgi:hypothetical protein
MIFCNRCEKPILEPNAYNFYVLHKECFIEHAKQLIDEFLKSFDLILNKKTYRFSTVGCDHRYDISFPSEELIKSEREKWEKRKDE